MKPSIGSFWTDRSGTEVLAEARQTPPAPDASPLPTWRHPDPATPLVGPWREPVDLKDAVCTLEELQQARRQRVVALGQLYSCTVQDKLYRGWGFTSLSEFARHGLGISVRTLERYRLLGDWLSMFPELGRAVAGGLGLQRAEIVAEIAEECTIMRWLAVARRTGVQELERAARMAGDVGAERVLEAYERAMASTTDTVALAAVQRPPKTPVYVLVDPSLPEAAVWFLEAVKPEKQYGFGRVKERSHFTCENPECGRRTLRCDAHHIQFRSRGGSDDLDNGACLCKACHLRLIHTGRVTVVKNAEGHLVWTYPGRTVTTFGTM